MSNKTAFMNNGRWIMRCDCGTYLPARENGVVCPKCYPNMLARALRQLPDGLLRPVEDVELVTLAREQAQANGDIHFPIYPENKAEIERILRFRPNPANMNWIPSETIEDLIAQNIAHGDPVE